MKLTKKFELTAMLKSYGFSFSKTLGQNFLIDDNILKKIIAAADISRKSNVLEIGPGAGTLTKELCASAGKVAAVEIDNSLIPILEAALSSFDNFTLINRDIMEVDIETLTQEIFKGAPFSVIANLPYYITTPIVMKFLESGCAVRSMTLMVQKEVAARMTAAPGSKDYGALSVAVRLRAEPKIICTVPPHCFVPQPKVTSTVIKLSIYEDPPYSVNDMDKLLKIVKSVFSQRRKTLVNSLLGSPYLKADKQQIITALNEMQLDERIRGEKLDIRQFIELSDRLSIL